MNLSKKSILVLALYAGEIMLKNGAETYRVEETIVRICKAYDISYVESFVTPTGIFVSIDADRTEQELHSFIKRIKSRTIDLNKVAQVNDFSRRLENGELSVEEGMELLRKIDRQEKYNRNLRILSAGMASAFFGALLGATMSDFFSSFLDSILVYLAVLYLDKRNANLFIQNVVGSAVAALLAITFVATGLGENLDKIVISSIMILLPGVAITNAVRDAISGDLLSGLSRASEAVIIAISIALGAGIIINTWIGTIGGTL